MSSAEYPLLVATTNPKKLTELQTLLSGLPLKLLCLNDLPHFEEVPETGKTFEENAVLKARGYAKQALMLALGEDSGLCCDGLEGAPGVYSARFAGDSKKDIDNTLKLLKVLEKMPDNCRTAYYKSVVAIASPEELIGTAEGEVHGYITREMSGTNGFGYDPVFFYPPFKKTFGEVPAEMKHQVSHRAQALAKTKILLQNYLLKKSPKP